MSKLRIAHLYPEHLNIYADRGNIAVLTRRCAWRGLEVEVSSCGPGDALPAADLYYLGGGQDRDQVLIADDLRDKGGDLRAAVDDGALVLAVCGGYQLLGHRYLGHTGEEMRGISLVDLETVAGDRRMIGNVVLRCELEPGAPETLVGFENHAGRTTLGPGLEPFGAVIRGGGNNGEDGGEGVYTGRVIGTYIHGPLLPKNPWLADWLIRTGLGVDELEPLDDALEQQAHEVAAQL